jgi:hypothetical protein
MRVYRTCTRVVAAIAIALILGSSGEAGFWRNRIAYRTYHQNVNPAPTQAAANVAATAAPTSSPEPASPAITSVTHEVVAPTLAAATSENRVSSEAFISTAPVVQPSYGNTGGWTVLPSRMSDYGKFPPYYH